jgi:hypothetical protein
MINKGGRPKIKLSDLREDWKEAIIELSTEGASIVELAVLLNISRDTFYALSDREPEFFDTVKKCKELCEAWWKRKGRTELDNKDFSYTGWYMNMKNRFGWADKKEIKEERKVETSIDYSKLDESTLKDIIKQLKSEGGTEGAI